MRKGYQRRAGKSNGWQPSGPGEFEVVAGREIEVRLRVGPPYRPNPASGARRWGSQPGYVVFGGQKIGIERPRVRTQEGEEVELENYRRLQQDGRMQRAVAERIVCGLSTRKYRRAVQ